MSIDVHDAAKRGNVAVLADYIRTGGDLYLQDNHGNPPLHVASCYGRASSVAALLGAGVDPDALNSAGRTPLHYAEKNGHKDCANLLRGDSPPTPRRQQMGTTDGGVDGSEKGKKIRKEKEKRAASDKGNARKTTSGVQHDPPMSLPTPPLVTPSRDGDSDRSAVLPPTAPRSEGQGGNEGTQEKWHLYLDEDGNAYYNNESTGESVWAEQECDGAPQDPPATAPPPGWSFYHDPTTGHPYYLNDETKESVWAESNGSFPVEKSRAGFAGNPYTTGGGGAGGASEEWEVELFFPEDRPAPSAPPPFSSTLEWEQAGEQKTDGNDMLLCTQGVMSTNVFFAARELPLPTSSGGSPMATAPPAMESGGGRSACLSRRACVAPPPADHSNSMRENDQPIDRENAQNDGIAQGFPQELQAAETAEMAAAQLSGSSHEQQGTEVNHDELIPSGKHTFDPDLIVEHVECDQGKRTVIPTRDNVSAGPPPAVPCCPGKRSPVVVPSTGAGSGTVSPSTASFGTTNSNTIDGGHPQPVLAGPGKYDILEETPKNNPRGPPCYPEMVERDAPAGVDAD